MQSKKARSRRTRHTNPRRFSSIEEIVGGERETAEAHVRVEDLLLQSMRISGGEDEGATGGHSILGLHERASEMEEAAAGRIQRWWRRELRARAEIGAGRGTEDGAVESEREDLGSFIEYEVEGGFVEGDVEDDES